MPDYLTTAQVAARLNITTWGVRQLILRKRLPAQKFGRDWQVSESDLAQFTPRKRGRPKQAHNEP